MHAAVGDHTNAQTYKDYLRLVDDPSSPRPSFTPLVVDQISTGFRVSCRRVCPTCDLRPVEGGPRLPGAPRRARHEASVAALAQTLELGDASVAPPPAPSVNEPSPPPPPPWYASVGTRTELVGACEQTEVGGDCLSGTLGAWEVPKGEGIDACVKRCERCARCRFVSFSAINADCSWFSTCETRALRTFDAHPEMHGRSYRTVRVKFAALPPPAVEVCASMKYEPQPPASVAAMASPELATLSLRVTVYVSASPRPTDGEVAPEASLLRAVESARGVLGLGGSRVVVVFDGVRGRRRAEGQPPLSDIRQQLERKVSRTRRVAAQHSLDIVTFDEWLHQANALRCAMGAVPRTDLLFSIQEDTTIGPPVETAPLLALMLRGLGSGDGAAAVEYVRFAKHDDCADEAGNVRDEYAPCTPHPEAAGGGAAARLQRVGFWSDRPHFATRRAYDERVFPLVQPTARVAPEQVFIRRVKRDTGLWVYGARGKMRHDLHEGGDARTRGRSYDVYAYHAARYRNGVDSA